MISFLKYFIKVFKNTRTPRRVINTRIEIPVVFCNKVALFVILDPFCNKGFRFAIN